MEKARQHSALAGLILCGLLAGPTLAGESYWQDYGDAGRFAIALVPDESDAFSIDIACRKGGFEVMIPVADEDRSGRVRLISGSHDLTYAVRYDDSEFGRFAVFRSRPNDPVLQNFKRTGRLSIGRYPMNAVKAAERQEIARFFRGCERTSSSRRP